jgi:hypothetical protein
MDSDVKKCSWEIYNKTRKTTVAANATRINGYWGCLLGVAGLPKHWAQLGNGLWIVECHIVHTIGVTFPIDLICLSQDKHVLYLKEFVRPFSIVKVSVRASSFLQLPPHTIYRSETRMDDIIEITPRSRQTELFEASDAKGGKTPLHC